MWQGLLYPGGAPDLVPAKQTVDRDELESRPS